MTIKSVRTGWTGISALAGNPVLGDFESIQTVTVGAGGQASIEFTSIPSTYTHLQLRGILADSRGVAYSAFDVTFNSDTGSNYSRHHIYGDSRAYTEAVGTSSATSIYFSQAMPGNTGSIFGAVIIDILDYANTSKHKTLRGLSGYDINSGGTAGINAAVLFTSGRWGSASAINRITLTPIVPNFRQYSHIALYGIR